MLHKYDYGDAVRVTRNVRNDGTFPGQEIGELLMRRGSVGTVIEIGTFLQDQIIYTVHFLEADRIVGCREEELIGADEPWNPSRFESREKVRAERDFAIAGEVVAPRGMVGEVLKVMRDMPGGVHYHVIFGDRVLCIPEASLSALYPSEAEEVNA
ncbi:nitrogen fixation protein NifZ [Thauera sp. CAU 1555]|uniref:Nitrogen fixation protein NifZ n=1 Tax=Thauera sedimentorum TaxID=2767595 RepID=A0ABR9BBN7_9RHOO|nr:nitrogen fixation protein NifZ [Thauera sedimentorum]MBC9072687.1 nitrogen fixation protein NifZ [Thauera sedimentorum]MBD8503606.1 nitrogen fixation protein NifZ [Thauera sedimentorum]